MFTVTGMRPALQTVHLMAGATIHVLTMQLCDCVVTTVSTVKHFLNGHSIIDKTKIFMTNSSLLKVQNIVECSPFGAFRNTFDLH